MVKTSNTFVEKHTVIEKLNPIGNFFFGAGNIDFS